MNKELKISLVVWGSLLFVSMIIANDILPGVSVDKIISYYESLIKNEEPDRSMPIGGIERNFLEEEIEDDEFYMRNGHTLR